MREFIPISLFPTVCKKGLGVRKPRLFQPARRPPRSANTLYRGFNCAEPKLLAQFAATDSLNSRLKPSRLQIRLQPAVMLM